MSFFSKPTGEQIERVTSALQTAEHIRYFFRNLENPAWIQPLADAGYFARPPEPIREGKYISLPPWPQSEYLARMAKHDPKGVFDLIKTVKTQNPIVHGDFVRAAIEMPPEIAVKLVPDVIPWLDGDHPLLLADRVADLALHLLDGGQNRAVFRLANALLEFRVTTHHEAGEAGEPGSRLKTRLSDTTYQTVLRKLVPRLALAEPTNALRLVCGKLADAIRSYGLGADGNDYSTIWMDDLAVDRRYFGDLKEALAASVRRTAEQIVTEASAELPEVLTVLEGYRTSIFHRLSLYLITRLDALNLAAARLTSPALWDRRGAEPEQRALLQKFFSRLNEASQEEVLQLLIRETPREKQALAEAAGDEKATSELEKARRARWLRKLAPIGDTLRGSWGDLYGRLVEGFGVPALEPEPDGRLLGPWIGPTSPVSLEHLAAMSAGEVIELLRSWRPPESFWPPPPSPRGLGRLLTDLIADNPGKLLSCAEQLRVGVHPTYIGHILEGLARAVAKGVAVDWPATLSLLNYVAHHDRDDVSPPIDAEKPFDVDRDWGAARLDAARLIQSAVRHNAVPFQFRQEVWTALEPLTWDPDPTPEDERRYEEKSSTAVDLAINSVRGEALTAVVQYALWSARHLRPDDPRLEHGPVLPKLPEVERVLDEHLEPDKDASPAIRSIYGRSFPWLALLSREWAANAIPRIFPTEERLQGLRWAAWDAYVVFARVYDSVYALLSGEYRRAVFELAARPVPPRTPAEPEERLAGHLATLYVRGVLDFDAEDSLILSFFDRAAVSTRASFVSVVGRGMESWEKPVEPELIERLLRLWDWRITTLGPAPARERQEELRDFGWWFAADVLPDDRSIASLLRTIALTGGAIEPDFEVIPKLARLSERFPLECVTALSSMVDAAGPHDVYYLRDHARPILQNALGSGEQACQAAVAVNDKLVKRGVYDFRELF